MSMANKVFLFFVIIVVLNLYFLYFEKLSQGSINSKLRFLFPAEVNLYPSDDHKRDRIEEQINYNITTNISKIFKIFVWDMSNIFEEEFVKEECTIREDFKKIKWHV